jgi:hypothetical protein
MKIEWKYVGPDINDQTVVDVESVLSVKLPADYLACLRKKNGGRPIPNAVNVSGRVDVVFENLLRLDIQAPHGVIKVWNVLRARTKEGVIPFASDPFGNLFCFEYLDRKSCSVVFWNHEDGLSTFVSNSFSELLEMLHSSGARQ